MRTTFRRIVSLVACLLTGFTNIHSEPVDDSDRLVPPVLNQEIFLLVPQDLWHLSDNWAEGLLRLRINTEGQVEDWIPLSLPHYNLFKPFEQAFAQYQCQPALYDGEPVPVDVLITIPLAGAGSHGVISLNVGSYVQSRMSAMNPEANALHVVSAMKLDTPLTIQSTGQPLIPVDENGVPKEGVVEVELYVDPNGVPRMIFPVGEPDLLMAEVAVKNVEKIRFNRPRYKGRPAVVKVRIPVILGGSG